MGYIGGVYLRILALAPTIVIDKLSVRTTQANMAHAQNVGAAALALDHEISTIGQALTQLQHQQTHMQHQQTQMLQQMTQIQQTLQAIQLQLGGADVSSRITIARAANYHAITTAYIAIPLGNTTIPPNWPANMDRNTLARMNRAQISNLLNDYGIAIPGDVRACRNALAEHIGAMPF